jgi:hypothetical protein
MRKRRACRTPLAVTEMIEPPRRDSRAPPLGHRPGGNPEKENAQAFSCAGAGVVRSGQSCWFILVS